MTRTKEQIIQDIDKKAKIFLNIEDVVAQFSLRMDIRDLCSELGMLEYENFVNNKDLKNKGKEVTNDW